MHALARARVCVCVCVCVCVNFHFDFVGTLPTELVTLIVTAIQEPISNLTNAVRQLAQSRFTKSNLSMSGHDTAGWQHFVFHLSLDFVDKTLDFQNAMTHFDAVSPQLSALSLSVPFEVPTFTSACRCA